MRGGGADITPDRNAPPRPAGRRNIALYAVLLGLAALLLLGAAAASLSGDPPRSADASPSPPAAAASPSRQPDETAMPGPASSPSPPSGPAATASPAPAVSPAPTPALVAGVDGLAVVPVVDFWSPLSDISLDGLRAALAGRSSAFASVALPAQDRQALADALGVSPHAGVVTGDAATVRRAVRDGALGLLRLTDVTPAVRALAVDGVSLFNNDRLEDLAEWPLVVPAAPEDIGEWRQADNWTMVAGGDIQLDRWMAYHVTTLDKGVDWPWDGGSVRITGRRCCSDLGHRVPEWESSGNAGAVRRLFSEADLALANLEAAAVDDPVFHRLGPRFRFSLSFSGDPRLLDGVQRAGFDVLSLANNHIHNAGPQGIADTRRHLERRDIRFAGAGMDVEQATRPAVVQAGQRSVAVLACTSLGRIAGPARAGAAPCSGNWLVREIRRLAAQVDVVVVVPHWGREYRATPSPGQRLLAARWVEAGADLVLGGHSHWVGSVEEIGDALVFYSLGNLAFDQPWSEPTMQGVIVEFTFQGDRLVQLRLHPTLIVDHVQPNLLERDAGGERVIRRMRAASEGLLPY